MSPVAKAGTSAPPQQAASPQRRFDPPKAFASTGVPLQGISTGTASTFVLYDNIVFTPDQLGSLNAVDATDDRTLSTFSPPNLPSPQAQDQSAPTSGLPVLAQVSGQQDVLMAELVPVIGTGTQADSSVLDVMAVDPTKLKVLWTATVPAGGATGAPVVLGVQGTTLMVALTSNDTSTLVAIDTGSHAVVWTKDGYLGQTLTGDTVIAIQPQDSADVKQQVVGLSVADGSPRWSMPNSLYQTSVQNAGPTLVSVEGRDYDSGIDSFQILNGNTGAAVQPPSQESDHLTSFDLQCRWDERSVVVCADSNAVIGVDSTTGNQLWSLPDAATNRDAPQVTTVWHGAVYGTTSHGSVVLDATTGKDLATPTIAPSMVSATTGLAVDSGQLVAYPATG